MMGTADVPPPLLPELEPLLLPELLPLELPLLLPLPELPLLEPLLLLPLLLPLLELAPLLLPELLLPELPLLPPELLLLPPLLLPLLLPPSGALVPSDPSPVALPAHAARRPTLTDNDTIAKPRMTDLLTPPFARAGPAGRRTRATRKSNHSRAWTALLHDPGDHAPIAPITRGGAPWPRPR
jgi:hypothetical protein